MLLVQELEHRLLVQQPLPELRELVLRAAIRVDLIPLAFKGVILSLADLAPV